MCRVGQIVSIQEILSIGEDRYYLYDRTPIEGREGLLLEVQEDVYKESDRIYIRNPLPFI